MADEEFTESVEERVERWLKGDLGAVELYLLDPTLIQALAQYGYLLYEQGRYETSKLIFEALAIVDNKNPEFQKILGSVYQIQGKWDAAYYRYTQSLRVVPTDIFVLTNRGETLLQLERPQEAVEDFKKAILLDPQGQNPAGRRARFLLAGLDQRA